MKASAEYEKAKRAHDLANAGPFASLSARARNILDREGIRTVAELAGKSNFALLSMRCCGRTTLREFRRFLHERPAIEKEPRPILDATALLTEHPINSGPGELHVGANDKGEVVINLPRDMTGHICFHPHQARHLAVVLIRQAAAAAGEPLP